MRIPTKIYCRPIFAVAVVLSLLCWTTSTAVAVPQLERPSEDGRPTRVEIGIFALDVDEVNTADQNFSASIYFEARWFDPRLVEQGITNVELPITEVWNPRLQVLNRQRVWHTFPDSVEIGKDGEVVYRQRVWGQFSQPLELHDFPFDKQRLKVQVVAAGYGTDQVELVPMIDDRGRIFGIADTFSLPDWKVEGWEMQGKSFSVLEGRKGIAAMELTIDISRYWIYFVSKVILPLSLIIMMSWVSLWINPKELGVNISAVMTAILTLVAYRFAISGQLPQVAYNTRMDNFIIASTFIVFATLLQVVINSRFVMAGKVDLARNIDRVGRVAYPLAFVVILIWSLFL